MCLIFLYNISSAQRFDTSIKFEGIADNREFFSRYNQAETIMGSRLSIAFGTTVDSSHQILGGLSYMYEFGGSLTNIPLHPILYYHSKGNHWDFRIGSFLRNDIFLFPHAMISEKYKYYKPTIEGILLSHKTQHSTTHVFADWISRQDSTQREQFMAGFTGQNQWNNFLFEEYFYLFHNAGRIVRTADEHIEDTMGGLLLAGYNFNQDILLDKFTVKTGVLVSAFRNRGNGMDFDIRPSWYSELIAEYKKIGIEAYCKIGNQHHFSHGDNYYNNTKNYLRTRFYFAAINTPHVQGRFMYSLHFTDIRTDHQQQFSLIYYFNNN